jgi:hypothetical protein
VWVRARDGADGAEEGPDPRHLEQDLAAYYTGLCGKSGHPASHTRSPDLVGTAHLAPAELALEDRAAGGAWAFEGEVQTVDCLVSGGEISLHVEAVAGTCRDGEPAPRAARSTHEGSSFVAYALSPRPKGAPIWGKLRAERRAFDCQHPASPEEIAARTTIPDGARPTIPDTPAGKMLAWVLTAMAHPPTEAEVTARLAKARLAAAKPSRHVEAFRHLGSGFTPPLLVRVEERGPNRVLAEIRSGDPDAVMLGRTRRLLVDVDPHDPSRLLMIEDSPPEDAGGARREEDGAPR